MKSNFGIFTTDTHLVIRTWDDWLEKVTSRTAAEVCGKQLTDIFPDIENRGLLVQFRRTLEQGAVELLSSALHGYLFECPAQIQSTKFPQMQQRTVIAPLRDDTKITGLVVTIEDVTARRAAELEDVEALVSEDWRGRRRAVERILSQPKELPVAELIKRLRREHRDPKVLNSVLSVLASSASDELDLLIGLTSDNDPELRMYAALVLGDGKDRRAIPALQRLLTDADINVRYHAIEALSKLKAFEAVNDLAAIAESGEFFLAFPAIEALASIAEPSVAHRLVRLLENETLRTPAIAALSELGDHSVVAPLVSLMDRPHLTATVAEALTTLHRRYEHQFGEGQFIADMAAQHMSPAGARNLLNSLNTTTGETLRMVVRVLGWIGDESIIQELTRLLGSSSLRTEVLETLARWGDRVTPLLCRQLESQDLEIRRAAVAALGRIGDLTGVPALIRALEDPELTIEAADALARIGSGEAYKPLLKLLAHSRAAVRQAAVGALNSIGYSHMRLDLKTLSSDSNPHVRESAVRIAGYFGYAECADLLLDRVHDVSENVRRVAIENLGNLQDDRVFSILLTAIRDESAKIRIAAAQSLGHLENVAALPQLIRALGDSDAWVRYYAARALAEIRSPESIDPLATALRQDNATQVRIAAADALGAIGGRRAVSILAPFVDFEDHDLARAALLALGVVGHPDALHPIRSALRSSQPSRRLDAVHAIGCRRDDEAAETLQWVAATDADRGVAEAAIEELCTMATPDSIAALLRLSSDRRLREKAIVQISRLGPAHLERVAAGLSSPQLETRRSVVEALGRMKHPEASAVLSRGLDDDRPEVRLAAVLAIRRLGSLSSEKKLLHIAQNDPDPGVREAAIETIQR